MSIVKIKIIAKKKVGVAEATTHTANEKEPETAATAPARMNIDICPDIFHNIAPESENSNGEEVFFEGDLPVELNPSDPEKLAKYVLEQLGEHSLLLLGRKWWRFKYSCWFEIDTLELEILVRKILMAPEAGLQGCHLKKGLIREIIDYLTVALFVDPARYSTPCFLPDGESAERWICFNNVLVNIDELAVKPPEECETRVRNEISKPLTRKEAAELLSVSMPTLNRMLNAGKLRRIRLSSQAVRVDPASIQTLLQQGAVRV